MVMASERTIISTEGAPGAIGPYSQAVRYGGLVFCSGQISLDPASGKLLHEFDVEAQTRRVMDNLSAVLAAAGSSFDRVLKATIFLTDITDFAVVNAAYGERFTADPPARATVEVSRLPKGAKVEIDVIAAAD